MRKQRGPLAPISGFLIFALAIMVFAIPQTTMAVNAMDFGRDILTTATLNTAGEYNLVNNMAWAKSATGASGFILSSDPTDKTNCAGCHSEAAMTAQKCQTAATTMARAPNLQISSLNTTAAAPTCSITPMVSLINMKPDDAKMASDQMILANSAYRTFPSTLMAVLTPAVQLKCPMACRSFYLGGAMRA